MKPRQHGEEKVEENGDEGNVDERKGKRIEEKETVKRYSLHRNHSEGDT